MQAAADRRKPDSYILYDIDNNRFEAESIKKLAEVMYTDYQSVRNVVIGVKSRAGLSKGPHKFVELTDPEGEAFVLTYPRAEEFLYSFDLSRFSVEQLLIKVKRMGYQNFGKLRLAKKLKRSTIAQKNYSCIMSCDLL